ncbi:MAG: phage BR0599 family protein, partial [Deltaproteobacteria bacterium]|nr:phage BR0599 family protein [Deltaproteobacteria bacterium]
GHVGDNIRLRYPLSGLDTGQVVTAFAGCARTLYDCTNKMRGNQANFGGFPFIPPVNPVTYLPSTTRTGSGGGKK